MLLWLGIWWSGRRGLRQARGPALQTMSDPAGTGSDLPVTPAPPQPDSMAIRREPSIPPFGALRISQDVPIVAGKGLDIPVLSSIPERIEPVQLFPLGSRDAMPEIPLSEMADAGDDLAGSGDALREGPEIPGTSAERDSGSTDRSVTSSNPVSESNGTASDAPPAVPETHLISGRFSRREPRSLPRTDTSGRFARVKADSPRPVQLQKIVSVRVLALAEEGWAGEDVAAALAGSDLVHGRYGVFHRLHEDGRTIFHVASLIEPGSFDPACMSGQTFPGLSIFAVLPGPMRPVEALEEMLGGARQIAMDLAGTVQDEHGEPLTPLKAGQLREQMREFQSRLQEAAAQ